MKMPELPELQLRRSIKDNSKIVFLIFNENIPLIFNENIHYDPSLEPSQ